MNSKERVFTALERKQPDRIPILEQIIDQKVIDKICKGCSYADFVEKMDLDAVCTGEVFEYRARINCEIIDEDKGIIKDKWNVIRQITTEVDAFPVDSPIKSEKDLDKYTPPDPARYQLGELPDLVKRFKNRKAIIWTMADAFEIPCALRGMENLLTDFIVSPRLAKKVIQMVVEYNIELAKKVINAGAEIMLLGDDYAYNSGPLMSPSHFRQFILPGLKKIVQAIKGEGAYCIKHTDGNIWPIIDLIVDTGVDAVNPIEPVAGMDIGEVKERYGDRICIIGNIDCGATLSHKSKEEVVKEVKRCIAKASPGGGHIMSSSNSIHSSVNPENYIAMIETTHRYGKYPLDLEALKV